jgi:RNA polymerase sigma-70 factor (ECF subfamily)
LLLVAWEELTPKQAAHALGVSGPAFRVRLLRARRRIQAFLQAEESSVSRQPLPDMETT